MKPKYQVLISGAGQMGAFFDSPASANILTHAHAFKFHPGFNLAGFVDVSQAQAKRAAQRWGVRSFKSISEAFSKIPIDIVSIATPIQTHPAVFKEAAKLSPRLILLEKPLAATPSETATLVKLAKSTKTPVAVNYFRRFLPEFAEIRKNIVKKKYGKFISGSGYYGRGLLNNGSHLLDLLDYFFGIVSGGQIINRRAETAAEPTVSASLTVLNGQNFVLHGLGSKTISFFEVDLIFEKYRLRIVEAGRRLEIYQMQASPIFKGYRQLVKKQTVSTSFDKYMYYVADNLYQHLAQGEPLKSDIASAARAAQACFRLLNKK